MTDLELLENKALLVLFMEHHLHQGQFRQVASTLAMYGVKFPTNHLEPAINPWVKNGWVKLYRGQNGLAAKLKSDCYGEVYKQVSSFLGATSLSIHADSKEVWSDASPKDDTPMLDGWKWLTYEQTPKSGSGSLQFDHSMTALPVPPRPSLWHSFWHSIDWAKGAAIAGWIGVVVMIVGVIVAIYLDYN